MAESVRCNWWVPAWFASISHRQVIISISLIAWSSRVIGSIVNRFPERCAIMISETRMLAPSCSPTAVSMSWSVRIDSRFERSSCTSLNSPNLSSVGALKAMLPNSKFWRISSTAHGALVGTGGAGGDGKGIPPKSGLGSPGITKDRETPTKTTIRIRIATTVAAIHLFRGVGDSCGLG